MLADKERSLEELKLETRNDLLQMKAAFSEKENEFSKKLRQQEDENKVLKRQLAG